MPRIVTPALELEDAEGYAPEADGCGPFATAALGDLGGLTHFGVRIERLPPGSASSMRHWHSAEDEFVMVLAGSLTLVEDTGTTGMGPGACAAFPAGRRNGHCLENRSGADATFLVAGWRAPDDVCTYSGRDRLCVKSGGVPRFTRRDGTEIGPEAETGAIEEPRPEGAGGAIDLAKVPRHAGGDYPEPHGALMAKRHWISLGDAGGLSQYGVRLVTIEPGGLSSLRHWHENEDEFIYVTEGELVLIEEDGETLLRKGDATAHPAGVANGHHMRNDSAAPATFLVIGTRPATETCHYPGIDMLARREPGRKWFARRDGTVLKEL